MEVLDTVVLAMVVPMEAPVLEVTALEETASEVMPPLRAPPPPRSVVALRGCLLAEEPRQSRLRGMDTEDLPMVVLDMGDLVVALVSEGMPLEVTVLEAASLVSLGLLAPHMLSLLPLSRLVLGTDTGALLMEALDTVDLREETASVGMRLEETGLVETPVRQLSV